MWQLPPLFTDTPSATAMASANDPSPVSVCGALVLSPLGAEQGEERDPGGPPGLAGGSPGAVP